MKVSEALDSIRNLDLVLPEFQREFVWTREQAKQLMVSLVRKYPVGSLLLWQTGDPPELKKISKPPDKLGFVRVLLDGQQRLTTLYILMTGEIPPYYNEEEIINNPRELYYNLSDGEFQYYQASKMSDDPFWQRVIDCFPDNLIDAFKISEEKEIEGKDKFDTANILNNNLNQIRAINTLDLLVQTVPSNATLGEAIDIFDRVNSQGTKLTDAELALTHVTGTWPQARREMKKKIAEYETRNFQFSLTFMVRGLTTVVTNRALFDTIHDRKLVELQEGWKKLTRVLDYLITSLPQRAFIHSTEDLNTSNALIPLVAFLSLNGGKFPNEESTKHAVNWLYAALMWARYTSQTDQRLEADVAIITKEAQPWKVLRQQIMDQRGRIEVVAADFAGRGTQNPLYRATFILAKAHSAVDWSNGLPLAQTHGKAYWIHSHHIFPQSVLYRNGFDPDDYTHRQLVNEIANRAFLTAEGNLTLSDTEPEKYLPTVEENYPGALASQFVPMDPQLWRVDRYREFLEARREMIARKLNEFMETLITEPEIAHRRPITELIKLGESLTLEFKSTIQWDVVKNEKNKGLRRSVLKTIAAFLNSDGGTLVIGVEEDGSPLGLEHDLKLLEGSVDRFQQLLVALISDSMGQEIAQLYKIRFENVDHHQICIVDVERAPEPIFAKTEKGKEFFVRAGNTTRALDSEEALNYIGMRRT